MSSVNGKVVLLTGASAGIGAASAKQLVKDGAKEIKIPINQNISDVSFVIGGWFGSEKRTFGRPPTELQNESGKFHPFQANLLKEEDILEAYRYTTENVGPVEIVINNAGIIRNGLLSDRSTEVWREVLDTNFVAVAISCREAVKVMKANNVDGYIININSTAGHYPTISDRLNVYQPSKHALKIYTENLRCELARQKSKIRVSSLSPGGVNTEIAIAGGLVTEEVLKNLPKDIRVLDSEDVVRCVMFMLSMGPLAHIRYCITNFLYDNIILHLFQITELIVRPLGEGA